MIGFEVWIDLLATAVAPVRAAGPAVVLHESQRLMPLLEQVMPVAWIHPSRPALTDFEPRRHQFPSCRERIGLDRQPGEAADLLTRAALRVLALPTDGRRSAALLELACTQAQVTGRSGYWLVHGPADSPTWNSLAVLEQAAGLRPVLLGPHRLLLSPEIARALQSVGFDANGPGLSAALARNLRQELPKSLDASLTDGPSGHMTLRIRPNPLRVVASVGEALTHHIMISERALINGRGLASVLLPWDACSQARLLFRNVRARIDDCEIVLNDKNLRHGGMQYTERGAILTLGALQIEPGRDALLHLSLPQPAVPADDFCDVGAVEFQALLT